ncbi:hypothetical protein FQN60_009125 [Etheostoma spectabile]|uniref:Uncharacterized protein n=1 Tax=Etheostoma spectabile TaxID=54343 RepID=A0A5J5CNU7_9PERO|nr:hypothetical protein FQN60_009125 [Etheostoma spectabile]
MLRSASLVSGIMQSADQSLSRIQDFHQLVRVCLGCLGAVARRSVTSY